jgi:hypothetical protein
MNSLVGHAVRIPMGVLCFLAWMWVAWGYGGSARPDTGVASSAKPPAIVIGFVGGFIRPDNLVHGGVQLAARLRKDYPCGVYVKVFENHRGENAHGEVLRLLDTNHDGKLSDEEKQNAQIIIYGYSWGGSETVTLARKLHRNGIPVLLTIQVDSVAKFGEEDSLIPPNVAEAVNFYQPNGLIRGRPEIRAEDPSRTQIVGNYRFDYSSHPVRCVGYPWFAIAFAYAHIEIECDPNVLNRLESLIGSKLPAGTKSRAGLQ